MATTNAVAKLIEAKVYRTLENELIAKRICTQKGIKNGDTMTFLGLSDVSVVDYTGGDVTFEELKDASIKLIIDKAKAFAFKVGDIQAYQSVVDLKGSQAERGAYQIRNVTDADILSVYDQAGTTVAATVTSANILSTLAAMRQKADENNVGKLIVVLPPWVKQKLILAAIKFSVNEGMKGAGYMGYLDALDMDIYISNNVTNTGTAASPVSECIACGENSIVFGDQIDETDIIEKFEKSFESGVKHLYTYGFKVLKPLEVIRATLTYSAETTI